MQRIEFICPRRKNIFADEVKAIIHVSVFTLADCVVKVDKEKERANCSQDNLRLERTISNSPKYLRTQEFRRFKHVSGNGRTRICKDKQYMKRTKISEE